MRDGSGLSQELSSGLLWRCAALTVFSLSSYPPEPGPSIAEAWRILFNSGFLYHALSVYSRPSAELFYINSLFSLHNNPINPILQISIP